MKEASPSPAKDSKSAAKSGRRRDGHADHVVVRNLFSLSILRRLTFLVILAVVCAALSIFSAIQVIKIKTPPQYIQLTQDGRIFPVAPLSQPNVGDGDILKFAAETVKWVNTYDYINWKDQLQESSDRFTPAGWNKYLSELVATDNLNAVQARKMVVSADFSGNAQIVKQGLVKEVNQYTWMVELPVTIKYSSPPSSSSSNEVSSQQGVVRLYVVRVPLEVNLRGYAVHIYQFDTSKPAPSSGGLGK